MQGEEWVVTLPESEARATPPPPTHRDRRMTRGARSSSHS